MITGNEPFYPIAYSESDNVSPGSSIRLQIAATNQAAMLSDNNLHDSDKDWFAEKAILAADALIAKFNKIPNPNE